MFIEHTIAAIYQWLEYIMVKWMASHTGLYTDMLIIHHLPGAAPVTDDFMKGPRYREREK